MGTSCAPSFSFRPYGKIFARLKGVPFGNVSLLSLGTHTPGGLPLQFPDDVTNDKQLKRYLEQWRPKYQMGTYRTYANPGIAMLGLITAKSMRADFRSLMQQRLFPALGLKLSFIAIPANAGSRLCLGLHQSRQADPHGGWDTFGRSVRRQNDRVRHDPLRSREH